MSRIYKIFIIILSFDNINQYKYSAILFFFILIYVSNNIQIHRSDDSNLKLAYTCIRKWTKRFNKLMNQTWELAALFSVSVYNSLPLEPIYSHDIQF